MSSLLLGVNILSELVIQTAPFKSPSSSNCDCQGCEAVVGSLCGQLSVDG